MWYKMESTSSNIFLAHLLLSLRKNSVNDGSFYSGFLCDVLFHSGENIIFHYVPKKCQKVVISRGSKSKRQQQDCCLGWLFKLIRTP